MKYIIDRFEGTKVILEKDEGEFIEIEKSLLPSDAKEGDCVEFKDNQYTINKKETERLKQEINDLMDDLFV
ncbi:MAG: DUF3006 domain-containing protein [Ruminococcus sp.]|nr:DUF3006 domain-containing protein [Ruminococcus sp.]